MKSPIRSGNDGFLSVTTLSRGMGSVRRLTRARLNTTRSHRLLWRHILGDRLTCERAGRDVRATASLGVEVPLAHPFHTVAMTGPGALPDFRNSLCQSTPALVLRGLKRRFGRVVPFRKQAAFNLPATFQGLAGGSTTPPLDRERAYTVGSS